MRITQAYVSKSLEGLDFLTKYGLTDYVNSTAPLAIFGMYRPDDLHCYLHHNGPVVLVWQGCDGKDCTASMAEYLKKRPEARHYAISHWISDSLKRHGIKHEVVPISATKADLQAVPRGDNIYFYYSDPSPEGMRYYGAHLIPEIKRRTGLNVIGAHLKAFSRDKLIEVYKESFVGVRLTTYDGCPNTVLELGLMGRRSIYNGQIPECIEWSDINSVVYSILEEYHTRHFSNQHISQAFHDFLNINLEFLQA